ncbi:uncharacterized protein [Pyxicephalus adspersus]|uniref:uncharacterized protein isoform X2 n=1 Tax=Pyxicephalus adspersus TaxID=30357 RepID=UPI003B58F5D7
MSLHETRERQREEDSRSYHQDDGAADGGDPSDEAPSDERSPSCKEEPLEEWNPTHILHSPKDLPHFVSVGMKKEPDQGEIVLGPIIERSPISEEGNLLHTDISMDGDLPHSNGSTHHTPTRVKEELFVCGEEPLGEPHVSPPCPPTLVPQEASLKREVTEEEAVFFKCDVVDPQLDCKETTQRQILSKPNQNVANGKQFSCTGCGKSCRSNAELVQHLRVHSGEKPFKCSECGKCFSQHSTLTMHHRIHTGQKPYTCSECGKSFTSKSDLTKHCRCHTGLKPYSCPECGKFFTSSSHCFRHKKMHIGDKQFICLECGKSFLTRWEMVIHQRIHTGERPYPCTECSKRFISSSDLVKHQRSHTGLKPHICPECGKNYVSRAVLTRHQKIHMAEKRYFCAECGMGFVRMGTFLAHVKSNCSPWGSSQPPN